MTVSGQPRLLIVDDEMHVREAVSTWFYQHGYFVRAAENGKIAVEICEQESFDIVVIDLEMPVMNGLDAITQIRAKSPQLRIVVFSGYSTQTEKVADLGVNRILQKPLGLRELEKEVRACLSE